MNEIMEGAATPAQIAGFGVALRMKGETAGRGGRAGRGDAGARDPDQRARPAGRPGRHRRGRGAHGQHLHDGRDRRRRGGRPDGQARQPRGLVGLRGGRRARGARRGDRPAAGGERRSWRQEIGDRVPVRAALPPGAAAHGRAPRASSACRPSSTSSARWPTRPGPRRRRSACPTRGWARSSPGVLAGRGCSALVFRGDDGLDELTTTAPSTVWVVHDGTVSQTRFDPAALGLPARQARRPARRGRSPQRGGGPRGAGRRARPGARHGAAQRRRGAGRRRPAWPGPDGLTQALADGYARAAAALDSGAAAALLDRWVEASQRLAAPA